MVDPAERIVAYETTRIFISRPRGRRRPEVSRARHLQLRRSPTGEPNPPHRVRSQSAAVHRSADAHQSNQRFLQGILFLANATNSIKRPGGIVRDEEAVGSNPATPTT